MAQEAQQGPLAVGGLSRGRGHEGPLRQVGHIGAHHLAGALVARAVEPVEDAGSAILKNRATPMTTSI